MAMDYTSLWEAFASGTGWTGTELGANTDYGARTTEFYDEIVGPAFGYDTDLGTADLQGQFGTEYTGLMANIDRHALEEGEKEFRMAIGDPYGRGDAADPFAWENISRMKTYENVIGEAQQMLEGELYHRGGQLGGSAGAAYGEGVAGAKSAYQSGILAERENLDYGVLTSGASLASGTSGTTLRSGESITAAEDVLIEAYKGARDLLGARQKTQEKTQLGLQTDLDAALKTYTDLIEKEKEDWYEDILGNVRRLQGMGTEDDPSTVFTSAREDWDASQYGGLTYADVRGKWSTSPGDLTRGFSEDVCGIGELWIDGECVLKEGLTRDEYGEIRGEGGLYPGCTDPNATNYNEYAETNNGSCYYDDEVTPWEPSPGDEEQQCPQGQIKTASGDCIDDPWLPSPNWETSPGQEMQDDRGDWRDYVDERDYDKFQDYMGEFYGEGWGEDYYDWDDDYYDMMMEGFYDWSPGGEFNEEIDTNEPWGGTVS